jgi:hypothetical protein
MAWTAFENLNLKKCDNGIGLKWVLRFNDLRKMKITATSVSLYLHLTVLFAVSTSTAGSILSTSLFGLNYGLQNVNIGW